MRDMNPLARLKITWSYLHMMPFHVACCISEKAIHDETLRVDAFDQRKRRLYDQKMTKSTVTLQNF